MGEIVELAFDPDNGYPVYLIDRRDIHDAGTLRFIEEYEEYEEDGSLFDYGGLMHQIVVTPEWIRQFRTHPLYVNLEGGAALLDSRPLRIVWTNVEDPHTRPILDVHAIRFPDLTRPGLVPLNLPEFDPIMRGLIDRIHQVNVAAEESNLNTGGWALENAQASALQLGVPYVRRPRILPTGAPRSPGIGLERLSPGIPRDAPRLPDIDLSRLLPTFAGSPGSSPGLSSPSGSPRSPRREIPPPQESPVLEALIARLYGLPVTPPQTLIVNGLPVPLVPFQEAIQMLQRNEVERYTIDPLNQVWAGPPGTVDRIVTLIRRDGTLNAIRARYDSNTGQIFPPTSEN